MSAASEARRIAETADCCHAGRKGIKSVFDLNARASELAHPVSQVDRLSELDRPAH